MTTRTVTLLFAGFDLEVAVDVTPYDPGRAWGPPESCYPPEGGEVEILSVELIPDGASTGRGLLIDELLDTLQAWDVLQKLVEAKLVDLPPPEPDYPDEG